MAHEDHFFATPNFHVFAMYAAHQGGEALRTEFSAPDVHYVRDDHEARFWGLNGSTSRKDGVVTLTIVNPDLSKTLDTQIALRGATVANATGTVLAASDMHAHNTFDQPNAVRPVSLAVEVRGNLLSVSIPAASVTKLDVVLG
jgi:alpha-N-arabinofuranosidase